MRVMVASDTVGSLSSARAGAAIGSGWAGADVRVLPIGEAGEGFVPGYADLIGAEVEADVEHGCLVSLAGTRGRGGSPGRGFRGGRTAAADRDVASRWAQRWLGSSPSGGRSGCSSTCRACPSTMPAPGCWPRWAPPRTGRWTPGLSRWPTWASSISAARPRPWPESTWSGVVPTAQIGQHLLGLRGITAPAGRAAGLDPADLLRVDAALDRFARLAAPEQADAPGAGACGGLGFAVLALGGRLATGPELAFASPAGVRAADRVSTWSSPVARSSTSPGVAGEWSRPRRSERRPRSAPAC